jgi:L-iditol 2-dehydrogenase
VGATLKAYGCQVDIVGTPADKERLEVAKVYGLKALSLEDLEKQQDYDLVADCSGAAGGINTALKSVRKGGDFLQVGIAGKPVSIDYDTVLFKELKIQGTFCHNYPTWERALTLESEGLIDVKPLLSDDRTIDQWEEAFEDLSNQKAMKILFKF